MTTIEINKKDNKLQRLQDLNEKLNSLKEKYDRVERYKCQCNKNNRNCACRKNLSNKIQLVLSRIDELNGN